jgi:hypothetical protein
MEWYYNFQEMIFQEDQRDKETGEMTWNPNAIFQSTMDKAINVSTEEERIELLKILKNRICFKHLGYVDEFSHDSIFQELSDQNDQTFRTWELEIKATNDKEIKNHIYWQGGHPLWIFYSLLQGMLPGNQWGRKWGSTAFSIDDNNLDTQIHNWLFDESGVIQTCSVKPLWVSDKKSYFEENSHFVPSIFQDLNVGPVPPPWYPKTKTNE